MQGTVFNIQRFSVNDGPGIRTIVFLKGCPLHCQWCHNPEGLSARPQLQYDPSKCIGCGECASVCPQGCHQLTDGLHLFDRTGCTACFACCDACPQEALTPCGRTMNEQQVLKEVLRDQPFYGSTGGVTLSGGEPMMQADFCYAILKAAHDAGIHTCIETSGAAPLAAAEKIFGEVDLALVDFKHADARKLKYYTGASLDHTLAVYDLLCRMGKTAILRCPIIPGVNDEKAHFKGIAAVADRFSCFREVQIMPYHSLGEGKRSPLGMEDAAHFTVPDTDRAQSWVQAVQKDTKIPVSLG